MTDIEQKALALLNEVAKEMGLVQLRILDTDLPGERALCRAIEQHEAFRQKVSDALVMYSPENRNPALGRFIINKPDPLVEVLKEVAWYDNEITAKELRAALEARGLEIREKNDD